MIGLLDLLNFSIFCRLSPRSIGLGEKSMNGIIGIAETPLMDLQKLHFWNIHPSSWIPPLQQHLTIVYHELEMLW